MNVAARLINFKQATARSVVKSLRSSASACPADERPVNRKPHHDASAPDANLNTNQTHQPPTQQAKQIQNWIQITHHGPPLCNLNKKFGTRRKVKYKSDTPPSTPQVKQTQIWIQIKHFSPPHCNLNTRRFGHKSYTTAPHTATYTENLAPDAKLNTNQTPQPFTLQF